MRRAIRDPEMIHRAMALAQERIRLAKERTTQHASEIRSWAEKFIPTQPGKLSGAIERVAQDGGSSQSSEDQGNQQDLGDTKS